MALLPASRPLRRSVASPATWSLERLDSLAAQIVSLFYQRCQEMGVAEEVAAAVQVRGGAGRGRAGGEGWGTTHRTGWSERLRTCMGRVGRLP